MAIPILDIARATSSYVRAMQTIAYLDAVYAPSRELPSTAPSRRPLSSGGCPCGCGKIGFCNASSHLCANIGVQSRLWEPRDAHTRCTLCRGHRLKYIIASFHSSKGSNFRQNVLRKSEKISNFVDAFVRRVYN